MSHPFIRNHQYNLIKKQTEQLLQAINTVNDLKVIASVKDGASLRILEAFPGASEAETNRLSSIAALGTAAEFEQFLHGLEPYLTEFPPATEFRLKKLFPKNKKLKVPNLQAIDFRRITYLGWTDIATNKMFAVYPLNGQLAGIGGRFTALNKKSVCVICHRHEEVALFTAMTKKPANASPDYYKAIGNYVCTNSEICNKNVTDVSRLERFFLDVLG